MATVGGESFDSFGNGFLALALLTITVGASDGAKRAHTTVFFVFLTVGMGDGLAWGFVYASQEATVHDTAGSSYEGFDDVAGIANAAISYDWYIIFFCYLADFVDSGELGDTSAGDDASGAGGTWSDAHS